MLAAAVVIVALLTTEAKGDRSTGNCTCCTTRCTTTVLDSYQPLVNWTFAWQLNLNASTITVELSDAAETSGRWLGIGFQANASTSDPMINAHAVVCQPGSSSVRRCTILFLVLPSL